MLEDGEDTGKWACQREERPEREVGGLAWGEDAGPALHATRAHPAEHLAVGTALP